MGEQRMIKGMPAWKYWQELRAKSNSLPKRTKPIAKKAGYRIPQKAKHDRGRKKKIPGLYEFFLNMCEICIWVCEECGANTYSSDEKYRIAVQAHLLPKEHFRSIATNGNNIMCLGVECGCHGKYDKTWESAMKMKVWPAAKKIIIEELIPLLPKDEYQKLPDQLKEEYEATLGNTN